MKIDIAVEALSALAHEGRLEIFRLLVRRAPDAVRAGEIAEALGVRATTLSNQLTQLEAAGLVHSQRDGRMILYKADTVRAGELISFLAADCCRNRPEACLPAVAPLLARRAPAGSPRMVLFLCSANSARSLMAEALLERLGKGRFRAFSAGSAPAEQAHPLALELLREEGFDISAMRPTGWDAFRGDAAPELDFVITLCDSAANENCASWPGQPMSAHWSTMDPVATQGDEATRRAAFRAVYEGLKARIAAFVETPAGALEAPEMQQRLDAIAGVRPTMLELN